MIYNNERIDDLECNGLKIIQNKEGYCFTMDAVLLANLARAKRGDRVVDLGTGSGIIPILMSAKTPAKHFVGVEIQERLADMASRSIKMNNLEDRIEIINEDMRTVHKIVGENCFDVAVSNPPYMLSVGEGEKTGKEKDICKREITVNLKEVIASANRLLKFGGNLFIIIKSDRLVDLIHFMRKEKIEPKKLTPIQPRKDKNIDTIIVEGKKGGKQGLIFNKPLIIYNSDNTYTKEAGRIYNR